MNIPIFQVDAFTNKVFKGNPAAVCILEKWLDDKILQDIAEENNLSETAFIVKKDNYYDLRWFTPKIEVDLCGHATLATAFVIFSFPPRSGRECQINKSVRQMPCPPQARSPQENETNITPCINEGLHLEENLNSVDFKTKSGFLSVEKLEDILMMDFPSRKPVKTETSDILIDALGIKPKEVLKSRDLLVVFENESQIKEIKPDFEKLKQIKDVMAVIISAPGDSVDFVSRFFAPNAGILEDPVTGSSHSTLIPFWAERLGKSKLHAHQLSSRGGELFCEDRGERVKIGGNAVLYLKGEIYL
jgi:predicted PhzF superfamily epimerase YddE/YHI9